MRLSASEKCEIIQEVTTSEIGVKRTLESFGIARSTFYKWYQKHMKMATMALKHPKEHRKDNGTAYRKNKKIW